MALFERFDRSGTDEFVGGADAAISRAVRHGG